MSGSGPGGRWFKSIRPDHLFRISDLQNRKLQRAPRAWPGGRWFKSIRPDHLFRISDLQNRKLQRAPRAWPGGRWFESICDYDSFPSQINALRCIFDFEFHFILRTIRTTASARPVALVSANSGKFRLIQLLALYQKGCVVTKVCRLGML